MWIQGRKKEVDVGPRFQGDPESNSMHLELLKQRSADIRAAQGDAVGLEEWDKGWTRVQ